MATRWEPIINAARGIVNGYSYLITLRQLHYRLVMTPGLGYLNKDGFYKQLSSKTAELRRQGTFPTLQDQTREIYSPQSYDSPGQAVNFLARTYTRDRTEGQDYILYLAGEKATLLAQLRSWFATHYIDGAGNRLYGPNDDKALGLPIILTRGYGSQSYLDEVSAHVEADGRKAILIYAGDFDASGEDILRDFLARCDVWEEIEHIAVRPHQVDDLNLPVAPGKTTDSRAQGFIDRHGELMQVEVEAIPPDTLRDLYQDALNRYWDTDAFDAVLAAEQADRERLREDRGGPVMNEAQFSVIAEIARRLKQEKVAQYGDDPDESMSDLMSFVACIRNGKQIFVVYNGPGPYAARQCAYASAVFARCDEYFLVADARYKTFEPLEGWREGMSSEEYEKLFYETTGHYPGLLGEQWESGQREGIAECLVISRYPLVGGPTSAHYMYERQGAKLTWTHVSQFDNDIESGAIQDYIQEGLRKGREIRPQVDSFIKDSATRLELTAWENEYHTDRATAKVLSKQPGVWIVSYVGQEDKQEHFKEGEEFDD